MNPWIGFDLDGTLAMWDAEAPITKIGPPVDRMVMKYKEHRALGHDARIVTARVAACGDSNASGVVDSQSFADEQRKLIEAWCLEHLGEVIPVTASKDFGMILLYDDRCVEIQTNTGLDQKDIYFGLGRKVGAQYGP